MTDSGASGDPLHSAGYGPVLALAALLTPFADVLRARVLGGHL
jgi:hypothetical protein